MLRIRRAILPLTALAMLGAPACSGDDPSLGRETIGEEGAAIVALDPALIGTFRATKQDVGKLSLLALKSDRTYHRALLSSCDERGCLLREDDGSITLAVHDGQGFIALHSERDGAVTQYAYSLRGGMLGLTPVGRSGFTVLVRADGAAWCRTTGDCNLQNLPTGPCAADWICQTQDNVCIFSCFPIGEIE
ncbi:MAG: hypothetical protein U0359_01030 [Byssovorax sp.]